MNLKAIKLITVFLMILTVSSSFAADANRNVMNPEPTTEGTNPDVDKWVNDTTYCANCVTSRFANTIQNPAIVVNGYLTNSTKTGDGSGTQE